MDKNHVCQLNGLIIIYPMKYYSSIKRNTFTCNNLDKLGNKYVKWKIPDTKSHMLYDSTYLKCTKRENP